MHNMHTTTLVEYYELVASMHMHTTRVRVRASRSNRVICLVTGVCLVLFSNQMVPPELKIVKHRTIYYR